MYKKINVLIVLAVMTFGFVACNTTETKTTADGVEYKLLKAGEGDTLVEGEYGLYELKFLSKTDSVLLDSEELGEMPLQRNDSILKKRGKLFSVLKELSEGDSIKCVINAAEVYSVGFRRPTPPSLEATEPITIYAKLNDIRDEEGIQQWSQEQRAKMMEKMKKEAEEQKATDDKLISEYLEENNIEAQKTESGLYYVITEEGNGTQPEAGDSVQVKYTGMRLDGTVFDTSYEEVAKEHDVYNPQREYKALEFPIGKGGVIPGWDEGIALLSVGGKGKLFIPSGLAYGPRARGEKIPANSILIFEVELQGIK